MSTLAARVVAAAPPGLPDDQMEVLLALADLASEPEMVAWEPRLPQLVEATAYSHPQIVRAVMDLLAAGLITVWTGRTEEGRYRHGYRVLPGDSPQDHIA